VLLLVVVVMIPTIGVLWFVGVATRNEQLANRQRLTDAYRTNLVQVQQKIDDRWREITRQLGIAATSGLNAQQRFDLAVATDLVDAVICFDAEGKIDYPTSPEPIAVEFEDPRWRQASRLEHQQGDPDAALKVYESIVAESDDKLYSAMALQSEVRCLLKLNRYEAALRIVNERFGNEFSNVCDAQGRLIAANVELMTLESAEHSAATDTVWTRLLDRLDDRGEGRLPASQRVFLMHRLSELKPDSIDDRLLAAEDLASRFVASHPKPAREPVLQASQIPGVWQIATPQGDMLLLLKTENAVSLSASAATTTELPRDVSLSIAPPGEPPRDEELISIQAGNQLPGWRLSLVATGGPIDSSVAPHQTLYRWTSALIVLFTSVLAIFIAASFQRQIRVANLKNDLVGTVSHELRTPLSSMRLLVDTLLDAKDVDPQRTRDYLQLIAKENSRLSRLIENFLTFSRLEQGKHSFEFARVEIDDLILRTVEAGGERFHGLGCSLTVDVAKDLPAVHGDADALVMALLNFLDNAYKYSNDPRELALRARLDGTRVALSVSDNGIGLSKSAARRIFQRFYQVDQSLVREGHGCGLGLSIVNSIVEAHGGAVSVASRPDHGSTFTLSIPAIDADVVT
jgi:signal transduction histidine kinase